VYTLGRPHLPARTLLEGWLLDARQLVGFDVSTRNGLDKTPAPEQALEMLERDAITR
jgi:hypothetical protein